MTSLRPVSLLLPSSRRVSQPISQPVSRRRLMVCSGSLALVMAGCSGGEPTYYTLTPSPGTPMPGAPRTVEVRTPSIASYLERDNIVRNDTNHQLTVADNAAWGGPLADMIGRNLSLDLGQRLPGSNVYTQSGAISTEALALVELDVSRFLEDGQGRAEIEATLAVYRPDTGPAASRSLHFTSVADGSSVNALVAALSQVLGRVADVAADALRSLPPASQPTALD